MNHLSILSSINVGSFSCPNFSHIAPKDLGFYLPIMLKVLKEIPDDVVKVVDRFLNHEHNIDISLRTLLFWLARSKLFVPTTKTRHWASLGTELDRSASRFFDELARIGPTQGKLNKVHLADPLFGIPEHVVEIQTLKVFSSQAKPCLLELTYDKLPHTKSLIFKVGDDISLDFFIQIMFFVFNKIWESSGLEEIPHIYQYLVVPTGVKQGCVQFVSDSISVERYDWQKKVLFHSFNKDEINRLICTAAGGFIGSFILGIRDRHRDNMMIKEDGTFFHIDFGYVFNKETWFDANRFAIPTEVKQILQDRWQRFINLCGNAYVILRRNDGLIIHLCTKLFSGIFPEEVIRATLVSAFQLHLSEEDACRNIKEMVQSGEASNKKKVKDLWHKWTKN